MRVLATFSQAMPALALSLSAQAPPVWGVGQLVEYCPGNAPIVISAPHGGHLEPTAIPNRSYGTTVQDRNTQELARALADELAARTGRRPHLVISHLHRRKLDPNRDVVEGAQGQPQAVQAWNDYHGFIDQAKATITAQWGRGLYVDVHGHGHPEGWVELGYALSASELAQPDAVLNQPLYINRSTLRALASRPGVSFPEALRGATSIGGMLENAGYRTVPSPSDPDPAGGNYFSGGYSVRRHGSRTSGTIDGVQAELPFSVRRDQNTRAAFVAAKAQAILGLLTTHQGTNPAIDPLVWVSAADPVLTETGSVGRFVVERRGFTAIPWTVTLRWSGEVVAGIDVSALPPTVTIPAGATRAEITVAPVDDGLAEGDEVLRLELVGGTQIGAPRVAECVLLDDDGKPDHLLALACDEGAGLQAGDRTGNGRFGVLQGGASWAAGIPAPAGAPSGQAIALDGIDDRLQLADVVYAAAPSGAHPRGFSWAFWFRTLPRPGSGEAVLLGHGPPGAAGSLNVSIDAGDGRLRTDLVYQNDESEGWVLDVHRDTRDGVWHHYALTSGPGLHSRVYLDGVEVAVAFHRGDTLDPSGPVVLGGRGDLAPGGFFAGAIDEIGLWDRPLAAAEVALLFAGSWPAAAVWPGSGEGLGAAAAVGGTARLVALADSIEAGPMDALELGLWSDDGARVGAFAAWVGAFAPPGPLATHPLYPALFVPGQWALVLAGPARLQGQGLRWSWTVPSGFGPARAIAQGLTLDPRAANGVFAASNAVELRFR